MKDIQQLIVQLCSVWLVACTSSLSCGAWSGSPFCNCLLQVGSYDPLPNTKGEKLVAINLEQIK